MTEQLGFDQFRRDRPAVDGNKWAVPAWAGIVNRTGQQFFTGTGTPFYKHGNRSRRNQPGLGNNPLHGVAAMNHAFKFRGFRGKAGSQFFKSLIRCSQQVRNKFS